MSAGLLTQLFTLTICGAAASAALAHYGLPRTADAAWIAAIYWCGVTVGRRWKTSHAP